MQIKSFYFSKEPSLWVISAVVISLHLSLLIWFCLFQEKPFYPKKNKLVVNTVKIVQQASTPAPQTIVKQDISEEPLIKPTQSPPIPEKKPQVEKNSPEIKQNKVEKKIEKEKPKKKEIVKEKSQPIKKEQNVKPKKPTIEVKKENKVIEKEPPVSKEEAARQAKQKELLKKAEENIANISKNRAVANNQKQTIDLEKTIPTLNSALMIDAFSFEEASSLNIEELGYLDELAGRLRLLLKLPEQGKVRIRLNLERSGKVQSVEILKSESVKNKKYIEEKVPHLQFPSFGKNFGNLSEHSFVILLKNE